MPLPININETLEGRLVEWERPTSQKRFFDACMKGEKVR